MLRFDAKTLLIPMASAALALVIMSFPGKAVSAAGEVKIDETNFPDQVFRDKAANFDKDSDGVLSEEEIADVTSITFVELPVKDLTGIEVFTNLEYLSVWDGELTSLDVSKNTKITSMDCSGNKITSIDLSVLPSLETLTISCNPITKLDLSGNPKLSSLACSGCNLETLDLSNNPEIWTLECDSNLLTQIDLSANEKLYELSCYDNKITSLDLSDKSELFRVNCARNQLTEVDLTNDTKLMNFNADRNKLKSISFKTNTDLEDVYLSNNELTTVDVSCNAKLKHLDVANNKLTSIDVSACTLLEDLFFEYNKVSSIDISNNRHLEMLWCTDNLLTSLTIDQANFSSLSCDNNKIKSIKIKGSGRWASLSCNNNQLTKLDVPDSVSYLSCYGNDIKELDISGNTALKHVYSDGTFAVKKTSDGTEYYAYNYEKIELGGEDGEVIEYYEDLMIDPSTKIQNGNKGLLTLDQNSAEVVCGKTLQLNATYKESASDVVWKSSDESIATVDANGKVTAKMAGTVTISAERNSKKAGCVVTVFYKDVTSKKDFWFTPTNELTKIGVVKGYDKQTKFKPANECTRAQMLTFIWRLRETPAPTTDTCKFPDVKKDDYFYKPVIWAVENGITTGYKDGTFKPQNVCTRAQTVTFLWRLAGQPVPDNAENKFSDVKESDYFYQPVLWASDIGIVAGYKDGTFKPQGKCLRRQMVTFLYKYDKFVNVRDSDS